MLRRGAGRGSEVQLSVIDRSIRKNAFTPVPNQRRVNVRGLAVLIA